MRYLLAISLMIVPLVADACWHPWTLYNSTSLFRLDNFKSVNKNIKETNCRHWQSLTHRDIPLEDIEYVVYTMPLAEYEAFYAMAVYYEDNAFAQWIKRNDPEIMDFLLLAKRNEHMRFQYSSKWYYPTMKVGGPVSLEEIVEQSLGSQSVRLRDRYLLQAVRALTTLKRYDECLELWDREISLLPKDNFMRRLCYEYIAGAYYHTGDVERAMLMFASYGDTGSMYYIAKQQDMDLTTVDIIRYSYLSGAPLSKFSRDIRKMIVDAETFPIVYEFGDKPVVTDEILAIRDLAIEAGGNPNCADRAQWLYIAAYIYMQQGNYAQAKAMLSRAEKAPASDYMKESIKVLSIYLDALTATYNPAYEERLFEQIKWFEERVRLDFNSDDYDYCMWHDFSENYWYSSMTRILSYTVAPRYLEMGNPARALQLMNFTDYLPYKYVTSIDYYVDNDYGYWWTSSNIEEYRRERGTFNRIDYSTWFFNTINKQTPDAAIAYVERALNPISEFDRYLNDVGYTSPDFLYDIVGTLCLRHMRYKEAERYFSLVSLDYQYMLNVMLKRDPFDALCPEGDRILDFRYRFATTMASLERGIEATTDQNRRAQLLLKYGIGMGNSVTTCWPLTYYGSSCNDDWRGDSVALALHNRAIISINEALSAFTDDELKAEALYALGRHYTVVSSYGYTKKAEFVRRHCDNYYDYKPALFSE